MQSILAATVFGLLLCCTSASAMPLESPAGDIVLTVTGDIENSNAQGAAQFDMSMLESLSGRQAKMETPWTNGTTRFDGPFLRAILKAVGAKGKSLRIKALNDYSAVVPMDDALNYDTILATRMNGQVMSVRDKGPLFMIYPFDEHPELYNEKYFSRSVWQIREIEVVD